MFALVFLGCHNDVVVLLYGYTQPLDPEGETCVLIILTEVDVMFCFGVFGTP